MVRFRYKRPKESLSKLIYFPYYIETWTTYDVNDTEKCIHNNTWNTVWKQEIDRDKLHRKNSYYYRRNTLQDENEFLQDSPTLAILLFGSIIFCLFVPQIIDILSAFWPRHTRPPSPPTPPPGPKNRKRLRLYHYAMPTNLPITASTRRKSFVGRDTFRYDTDNILNYVSETRIKALHAYSDEEDEEHHNNKRQGLDGDPPV